MQMNGGMRQKKHDVQPNQIQIRLHPSPLIHSFIHIHSSYSSKQTGEHYCLSSYSPCSPYLSLLSESHLSNSSTPTLDSSFILATQLLLATLRPRGIDGSVRFYHCSTRMQIRMWTANGGELPWLLPRLFHRVASSGWRPR